MEDGDDAYEILGVSLDASSDEIKKAYRKLALRHHPDKQSTTEEKERATVIFAKISNAYELLGDDQKRREYDMQRNGGGGGIPGGFGNGFGGPDPFTQHHHQHHQFHHNDPFHSFHFHDPFQVFEQFFQDFHNTTNNGAGGLHRGNSGSRGGSFQGGVDPFLRASQQQSQMMNMMMGGGGLGGSFHQDPFFGGGFGGGMMADPFAMMRQSMSSMGQGIGGGDGTNVFTSVSSSTSSFPGGMNSSSVSTSTTTRIVNGRRQTVTETVVQRPDGTVERQVQTDGHNDTFNDRPRLPQDNHHSLRQMDRLEQMPPEFTHNPSSSPRDVRNNNHLGHHPRSSASQNSSTRSNRDVHRSTSSSSSLMAPDRKKQRKKSSRLE